jgi:hypothetical protein
MEYAGTNLSVFNNRGIGRNQVVALLKAISRSISLASRASLMYRSLTPLTSLAFHASLTSGRVVFMRDHQFSCNGMTRRLLRVEQVSKRRIEHARTNQSVGRLKHRGMGGYLRGGFYGIQCARRYCSSRKGWLLRVKPLNKQKMEHSRTNLSVFRSGYQVFDRLKMFTRSISLISGFGMKRRVVFVEISHQRCFCDS